MSGQGQPTHILPHALCPTWLCSAWNRPTVKKFRHKKNVFFSPKSHLKFILIWPCELVFLVYCNIASLTDMPAVINLYYFFWTYIFLLDTHWFLNINKKVGDASITDDVLRAHPWHLTWPSSFTHDQCPVLLFSKRYWENRVKFQKTLLSKLSPGTSASYTTLLVSVFACQRGW